MGNACQCWASRPGETYASVSSPLYRGPHASYVTIFDDEPNAPLPSIDSLILRIREVDQTDQIDQLMRFNDNLFQRIKGSEATLSSSLLDSATTSIGLGATFIDIISAEAAKLKTTDIAKEMRSLALNGLKKVGEAHWVFLGLSAVAFALERFALVNSNVTECIDLLQAFGDLAKDLIVFRQRMPHEEERLCRAVQIIVEGSIMIVDYMNKGRLSRYWLAPAVLSQLEKTNEVIRGIRSSLGYAVAAEFLRMAPIRLEESPFRLLEFQPVGIAKEVETVKKLLDMEGTVPALAVALCGFGGLGKSTLAASVIQNLYINNPETCADFNFSKVIIDNKSVDEISHIMRLQQEIIYDLKGGKQDLRNPQDGQRRLQEAMENKCCLLFIDNVVDKKYVRQLLPGDLLWLNRSQNPKAKLRILITSRQKNIKPALNIMYKEYDVRPLSTETARRFLRETILYDGEKFSHDFEESTLMNAVADACRGVPKLLSVFGMLLKDDRNPERYKEAQSQASLDIFADEDFSEQLFFVYSTLRKEDKEALLDICKYFHGWEWDLLSKIIDEARLLALWRKMLIEKNDSGVVIVADFFRLMGEKEAKQSARTNKTLKAVKKISKMVREISKILLDIEHGSSSALNTSQSALKSDRDGTGG